jgi:hypothetical protein
LPTEYTELLRVRLPESLATAVCEVARRDCMSVSELTRQALLTRVRAAGVHIEVETQDGW